MHTPVHYFIAQERATHLRYEAERSRFPTEDPGSPFLVRLKSRLNGHFTHGERAERLNGRPAQSESCA